MVNHARPSNVNSVTFGSANTNGDLNEYTTAYGLAFFDDSNNEPTDLDILPATTVGTGSGLVVTQESVFLGKVEGFTQPPPRFRFRFPVHNILGS